MLSWLSLQFTRGADIWHKRDVNIENILSPYFLADLASSLKKWLRFNVTNRATDLSNNDIDIWRSHSANALFNLISDVRNHLNSLA